MVWLIFCCPYLEKKELHHSKTSRLYRNIITSYSVTLSLVIVIRDCRAFEQERPGCFCVYTTASDNNASACAGSVDVTSLSALPVFEAVSSHWL